MKERRYPYLSCPAVSQISNFTVVSSKATVCVKNAAPMVGSCKNKQKNKHKTKSEED